MELTVPASVFGLECFYEADIANFVGKEHYFELDDGWSAVGVWARVIRAWPTGEVCETSLTSKFVGLELELIEDR